MSQFAQQRKSNADTSKSFADLRLKLRDQNQRNGDLEIESRISDLSGDEWNEIVKYEKDKFEEERQRQKSDFLNKRKLIKETLDKQLRERNQRVR